MTTIEITTSPAGIEVRVSKDGVLRETGTALNIFACLLLAGRIIERHKLAPPTRIIINGVEFDADWIIQKAASK